MKLFFQKLGQGPVIVILHGLYGFSDNWITIARNLAPHYTVYLADQRNHGRSPHDPKHSYPAMMEDLYETITAENLHDFVLLGHSMGGKTAMLFAATHPEVLRALVVVDIGPGSYVSTNTYSPQAITHLNIVNAMLATDLSQFHSRVDIERELAKTLHDPSIRQFIMKNVNRKPDNSFEWKLNVQAISAALPAIMGAVALDKAVNGKEIDQFPVLFIKGGLSGYIDSRQTELIHEYFPYARIQEIAGAGHWIHADQPEVFMKVLKEFLQALP